MLDALRLVSSEDVGRDEANVQSLLKKHKVGLFCGDVFLYATSCFFCFNFVRVMLKYGSFYIGCH